MMVSVGGDNGNSYGDHVSYGDVDNSGGEDGACNSDHHDGGVMTIIVVTQLTSDGEMVHVQ